MQASYLCGLSKWSIKDIDSILLLMSCSLKEVFTLGKALHFQLLTLLLQSLVIHLGHMTIPQIHLSTFHLSLLWMTRMMIRIILAPLLVIILRMQNMTLTLLISVHFGLDRLSNLWKIGLGNLWTLGRINHNSKRCLVFSLPPLPVYNLFKRRQAFLSSL